MKLPLMGLYVTDFWGDGVVQRMPRIAQSAYLVLLTAAWQGHGVLADPEDCLEAYGFDRDLWKHIQKAWDESPEGWTQKRLSSEWEKAMKRVEGGKKGGRAKQATSQLEAPLKPATTINANANANANATPNTHTVAPAPPRSKKPSRKPTRAQVKAAVAQHIALQALPGFADGALSWWEALGAKKRWASVEALTRHLRWLEQRPFNALALVTIATENAWTDPSYAEKVLARDRGETANRFQQTRSPHLR